MSDYMQDVGRLADEYAQAVHDGRDEDCQKLRAALLAHIERGWKLGEPVAWYDGRKFYGSKEAASVCCADMAALTPIFAAPAAPDHSATMPIGEPLTDEQLLDTVRAVYPDTVRLAPGIKKIAAAIEAAGYARGLKAAGAIVAQLRESHIIDAGEQFDSQPCDFVEAWTTAEERIAEAAQKGGA